MPKMSKLWSNPLFIIVMILLILVVILSVFRSVSPSLTLGVGINAHLGDIRGSFELETFDNGSDSKPAFVMYYAEWCGHCKTTMPQFQKLMQNYKGNVSIMPVNSESPENKDLIKSQEIKGFPTIRYYPSGMAGNYEEYTGERSYTDFVQYLGSVSGVPDKAPDMAAPVGSN